MGRKNLKQFKKKALENDEVKEEYNLLKSEYDMKKKLITMRKEAGLTQEKLAVLMGTKKSNISRLESFKNNISPRLDTLINYAHATGHKLKIDIVEEIKMPKRNLYDELKQGLEDAHDFEHKK